MHAWFGIGQACRIHQLNDGPSRPTPLPGTGRFRPPTLRRPSATYRAAFQRTTDVRWIVLRDWNSAETDMESGLTVISMTVGKATCEDDGHLGQVQGSPSGIERCH